MGMQIKLVVAVVDVGYNHILVEVYTMYILRTRRSHLNPFTAKYDQRQIRQKSQISFCKIF